MKITFLGTGTSTGIPLIGSSHPVCLSQNTKDKRLRSSIKIDFDDNTYIIDCGPDFRQQMINSNCKKIDGILSLMNMLIILQVWTIYDLIVLEMDHYQFMDIKES